MPRMLFAFVLTLAIAIGGGFPQSAFAKSKPASSKKAPKDDPKNALIIKALGGLKWGQTKAQVIEELLKESLDEVRANPDNQRDRIKMQSALDDARKRSKDVENSYTELTKQSNFGASVIADEYIPDHNESFVRLDDAYSQRYYFFYRDRLYKYVVVYNRNYLKKNGGTFADFAGGTADKYGRPTDGTYEDDDDTKELTSVRWDSKDAILILQNKSRFFGTYTMTFAQPTTYGAWTTAKRVYESSQKSTTQVSAQVRSLIDNGDGDSAYTRSAVRALVGDVQLDTSIAKQSNEESTSLADAAAKKQAEEKKNAKKKAKTKKKRSKKKVDLSNLKVESGKGLIIY